MENKPSFIHRVASMAIASRARLPRWVNRILDTISFNPDSLVSKTASALLGSHRKKNHPKPSAVPDSKISIYIAPTNYAGQGSNWAKALTDPSAQRIAINMAIDLPHDFGFDADTHVPVAVYNHSKKWQKSEFSAVRKFTHVLIEAEKPLFGSLFGRDVTQEISELKAAGVSVAFISHGDDIRSPETSMELTRWSPYFDDEEYRKRMQSFADKNLTVIRDSKLPAFVSTPDLLLDVDFAHWAPVVVDPNKWRNDTPLFAKKTPIVAHIPSMAKVKGTHFIEQGMMELERAGVIEYRRLENIKSTDMPKHIAQADIILDQFRVGSYGVAACESMAAGKITVGHIPEKVRNIVQKQTGKPLPILEADPESLPSVISNIVANPNEYHHLIKTGKEYVKALHSGPYSAKVLLDNWIIPTTEHSK